MFSAASGFRCCVSVVTVLKEIKQNCEVTFPEREEEHRDH